MGFDVENFGLGLLAGWGSALGVYLARRQIGSVLGFAQQQASSARNYATSSADSRYINDLVNYAQTAHLGGSVVKLTDILIEPRFLHARPFAAPPDDDKPPSVFELVPHVPDHPYLLAPYNVETISLEELSTGERTLALLGAPGSGRTTALLTIALWSLNKVDFTPPPDPVQRQLEAEEAALSDKDRAARIKERMLIAERARERLAEQRGEDVDEALPDKPSFKHMLPVYVHFANIEPNAAEFSGPVDPAEPLVRAVQFQVGPVTARTIARNLYRRLGNGQVLLLLDGYDDLPPNAQKVRLAWLRAFMKEYGQNFIIVAGPVSGYGSLTRLAGLTPVFLRPWSEEQCNKLADHWAAAWPLIVGTRRRPGPKPDPSLIARAKVRNFALSPVDLTLKIWATYANDVEAAGFEGWLRAYIARLLPNDQSLDALLPQLVQAATLQIESGFITQPTLEAMAGVQPRASAAVEEPESTEQPADAKPARKGKKGADDEKEETSAQGKFIAMLRRSGLLTTYRSGRYQFVHGFLAAYLASLSLKDASTETLAQRAMHPAWTQVLAYAAAHMPIDAAVRARMEAPSDLLHNHLLEVARWLSYAEANVSWRAPIMRQLGNLFVAPAQFPLIRERIASALITTRDRNASTVFRQGIRHSDPQVRQLSALGLGALRVEDAMIDINSLLDDKDTGVQIAAGLALAALGTDQALNAMVEALMTSESRVQQAIAEAFAAIPNEGYPLLYDAIQHEEMSVRRAAVFGLRRLKTPWALIAIYRAFLEDQQWYVRSAAQQAFTEMHYQEGGGPVAYPETKAIPWLLTWASDHGQGVPSTEVANQLLLRALQEGEPEVRVLSAATLGQLGMADTAKPLYTALCDRNAALREAAYRALGELQLQMGSMLPSPA